MGMYINIVIKHFIINLAFRNISNLILSVRRKNEKNFLVGRYIITCSKADRTLKSISCFFSHKCFLRAVQTIMRIRMRFLYLNSYRVIYFTR